MTLKATKVQQFLVFIQLSKARSYLILIDDTRVAKAFKRIMTYEKKLSDSYQNSMAKINRPGLKDKSQNVLLQSQKSAFSCIAWLFCLFVYLITGALEWFTFSSGIDSKDSSLGDKLPQA